ncbi:MAG: hypothetical protein JOY86_00115 [Candidatus Eremiobacteraeota bacterium]|nr:hypothetical protein [Candidatus Eremiobacteraeota bacterium]
MLSDALRYPLACEAAFADPSRRDARGRVARSSSYQPPLEAVLQRAREIKGHALAVKIAPGLRVGPDSLRSWCEAPVELEYVSERGECKEAVIWCGDFARGHGARRASVTDADGCHELDGPADRAAVGALRRWLAEPDPAVIRAGLIGELCRRTGATLVDSDVAYMTADSPIASPFARWFEVVDSMPFGVKRVRATLRSKDFGKLTIKTRAFPLAPDEIAALLKTHGEKAALLVCTTFGGVKTAVICKPPAART